MKQQLTDITCLERPDYTSYSTLIYPAGKNKIEYQIWKSAYDGVREMVSFFWNILVWRIRMKIKTPVMSYPLSVVGVDSNGI